MPECLTSRLWPARSGPKPGELLSSWLARLAAAHGLSYTRFCMRAWPEHTLWRGDVDLHADDDVLGVVSERTGVGRARVEATTLASLRGWLFPGVSRSWRTAWVLPGNHSAPAPFQPLLRSDGSSYRLQYCPLCLSEDKEPYFRLHWRLAFVTACERHERELDDQCPKCGGPIVPRLADTLDRASARSPDLARCYRCRSDLRRERFGSPSVEASELAAQRRLARGLERRWMRAPNGKPTLVALIFPLCRQLLDVVSRGARGVEARAYIGPRCGIRTFEPSGGLSPTFERLPAGERRALLRMTLWTLDEWPQRFVDTCTALGSFPMRRADFEDAPCWFQEVLDTVSPRPIYRPSEHEIAAAVRALWKRGDVRALPHVASMLGVTTVMQELLVCQRVLEIVERLASQSPA